MKIKGKKDTNTGNVS